MKQARRGALIIGLGLFGRALAERLVELGWEVFGIDRDSDPVQEMRDRLDHVVQLDASDEEALATVGVKEFEVCVVTSGSDVEGGLLLVLNLQHLGAARIIAKATTEYHARILRRLGVGRIVFPERDAGKYLAESLQAPNLIQWVDLANERELGMVSICEARAGQTLSSWRALRRPDLRVVGSVLPKKK